MLKIFENLINKFDIESKCGFCWKFFATGRQDYSNLINTGGCNCIVFIFETWSTSTTVNRQNGETTETVTIDGFIGFQSHLSESFYNEGVEKDCNNRYENYIEKLEDCLKSGLLDMICIDGEWYQILSTSKNLRLNYLDQNLDGFKLRLIYST